MKQETLDFVVEKTNDLINSATCCDELKEVANTWLKALGTAQEKKQTEIYLAKLQEDIMPIDGLITFAYFSSNTIFVASNVRISSASGSNIVFMSFLALSFISSINDILFLPSSFSIPNTLYK